MATILHKCFILLIDSSSKILPFSFSIDAKFQLCTIVVACMLMDHKLTYDLCTMLFTFFISFFLSIIEFLAIILTCHNVALFEELLYYFILFCSLW